jgi:GTP-binding protein
MRRRSKVVQRLEKLSVDDSLRVIRLAEVVVLMVDAEMALERQDLIIAKLVVDEGRALVIAVNKWDLVGDRRAAREELIYRLEKSLPQIKGVPVVAISALRGDGVDKLMPAVFKTHKLWNERIATGRLNRWFDDVVTAHPPPMVQGRRIKLRYITQVKARPPTFAIFLSKPKALPEAYLRYLVNQLRETFKLVGVPIRLLLRGGKNPYVPDDKRR